MKKTWISSAALAASIAFPACGDDATPSADTTITDTAVTPDTADTAVTPDTADTAVTPDTADTAVTPDVADTTVMPDAVEDTTVTPDAVEDTTVTPDAVEDTTVTTSTLADLLVPFVDSTNDFTTSPGATVEGLVVTLIKPVVGTEAGGFFVQEGGATGVAGYVLIEDEFPAGVMVGATVSLQIDTIENNRGVVQVSAHSNLVVTATGADLAGYKTDVAAYVDAAAYLANAGRLITLAGNVTSDGIGAGGGNVDGYLGFGFTSTGIAAEIPTVTLRIPKFIVDAVGLESGCSFEVTNGTVWAYRSSTAGSPYNAQASVFSEDAFVAACESPTVSDAEATNNTTVIVNFTRPLDAATVNAGVFTIAPVLDITEAVLSADGRSVMLTTAAQTTDGAYVVNVATTVTDVLGEDLVLEASSATFIGADGSAPVDLPIGALWCFNGSADAVTLLGAVSDVSLARDQGYEDAAVPANSLPAPTVSYSNGLASDLAAGCEEHTATAFSSEKWTEGAFNETHPRYLELTFSHGAGRIKLDFDARRSSKGPVDGRIWSSEIGDMATDVLFPDTIGPIGTAVFDVDAATTHTIRIYGWNATTATGTLRFDNIVIGFAPAE